eukprot:gene10991-16902_t
MRVNCGHALCRDAFDHFWRLAVEEEGNGNGSGNLPLSVEVAGEEEVSIRVSRGQSATHEATHAAPPGAVACVAELLERCALLHGVDVQLRVQSLKAGFSDRMLCRGPAGRGEGRASDASGGSTFPLVLVLSPHSASRGCWLRVLLHERGVPLMRIPSARPSAALNQSPGAVGPTPEAVGDTSSPAPRLAGCGCSPVPESVGNGPFASQTTGVAAGSTGRVHSPKSSKSDTNGQAAASNPREQSSAPGSVPVGSDHEGPLTSRPAGDAATFNRSGYPPPTSESIENGRLDPCTTGAAAASSECADGAAAGPQGGRLAQVFREFLSSIPFPGMPGDQTAAFAAGVHGEITAASRPGRPVLLTQHGPLGDTDSLRASHDGETQASLAAGCAGDAAAGTVVFVDVGGAGGAPAAAGDRLAELRAALVAGLQSHAPCMGLDPPPQGDTAAAARRRALRKLALEVHLPSIVGSLADIVQASASEGFRRRVADILGLGPGSGAEDAGKLTGAMYERLAAKFDAKAGPWENADSDGGGAAHADEAASREAGLRRISRCAGVPAEPPPNAARAKAPPKRKRSTAAGAAGQHQGRGAPGRGSKRGKLATGLPRRPVAGADPAAARGRKRKPPAPPLKRVAAGSEPAGSAGSSLEPEERGVLGDAIARGNSGTSAPPEDFEPATALPIWSDGELPVSDEKELTGFETSPVPKQREEWSAATALGKRTMSALPDDTEGSELPIWSDGELPVSDRKETGFETSPALKQREGFNTATATGKRTTSALPDDTEGSALPIWSDGELPVSDGKKLTGFETSPVPKQREELSAATATGKRATSALPDDAEGSMLPIWSDGESSVVDGKKLTGFVFQEPGQEEPGMDPMRHTLSPAPAGHGAGEPKARAATRRLRG